MHYKLEIEQAAEENFPYTPIAESLSLTKDPRVQGTRRFLMILIGVTLALSLGSGAIGAIADSEIEKYTKHSQRGTLIREVFISILFNGFGLLIVYRYSATGLHVFAWLSIVTLTLSSIRIGLLLYVTVTALIVNVPSDETEKMTMTGLAIGGSIFILLYLIDCVLRVIIVYFTFKLARFIRANKHSTAEQIEFCNM